MFHLEVEDRDIGFCGFRTFSASRSLGDDRIPYGLNCI